MEQIENTPFWAVKKDEENYIIVLGKYQISDPDVIFKSKKEISAYLKINFWDIILKLFVIFETEKNKVKDEH